ncbi:MAG: hypothetical protein ACHQAY_27045 [Hyphomicrobiales bacterium]
MEGLRAARLVWLLFAGPIVAAISGFTVYLTGRRFAQTPQTTRSSAANDLFREADLALSHMKNALEKIAAADRSQ